MTEPPTICDACPEFVDEDARCTHGKDLCVDCLTRCKECCAEFAEDAGLRR